MPLNSNTIGRAMSNRSSNTLLGLALSALYLNLSLNTANGSQFYQLGPMVPVGLPWGGPGPWSDVIGGVSLGSHQNYKGFSDGAKDTGGFRNNGGFYDDLFSNKNVYDIGKGYGTGIDYGRGGVVGGGYRDLGGRNKGHKAAGFSTSYRKDESGDQSTYYDDGLGHQGKITYGAHDNRFRDQGGSLKRGGYHDSNLNRAAIGKAGRFGDSFGYKGYAGHGGGYGGHGGGYTGHGRGYAGHGGGFSDFGKGYFGKGYRHGRFLPPPPLAAITLPPPPPPTLKNSGVYVIPMPDKLYFDQTIAPLPA